MESPLRTSLKILARGFGPGGVEKGASGGEDGAKVAFGVDFLCFLRWDPVKVGCGRVLTLRNG